MFFFSNVGGELTSHKWNDLYFARGWSRPRESSADFLLEINLIGKFASLRVARAPSPASC